MADAFIVDALRSPTGKRKGSLAAVHGADLGAHVIKALVQRNAIPAEDYDDVIFGCVDTIGSLAGDIARTAWLAAGLPMCVPGTRHSSIGSAPVMWPRFRLTSRAASPGRSIVSVIVLPSGPRMTSRSVPPLI